MVEKYLSVLFKWYQRKNGYEYTYIINILVFFSFSYVTEKQCRHVFFKWVNVIVLIESRHMYKFLRKEITKKPFLFKEIWVFKWVNNFTAIFINFLHFIDVDVLQDIMAFQREHRRLSLIGTGHDSYLLFIVSKTTSQGGPWFSKLCSCFTCWGHRTC